nr:sporulation integral membrane protein YtvI [Parablautia muri]
MLVILLLCMFVLPKVVIYFMPFVLGWVIAWIASPPVRFFEKKLKIKRMAGSAFVIITVIALVILAGYFLGVRLTEQIVNFIGELPKMWEGAQEDLTEIEQKLDLMSKYLPRDIQLTLKNLTENVTEYLGSFFGDLSMPTIEAVSRFAMNLPSILIGIIMCLLSAYFFVADREYLPNLLSKAMPESIIEHYGMIKRGLKHAVGGYFKAQIKIELWMYVLLCIGFSVLKIRYAFIIAIGVAFLDFLPFFGTGTVLLPWAVIKFLSGDYPLVMGLLIIWGVGQLARQLIQPKIVGESVGLSPIPTLFLLYIGYKTGGVVGMILAVPIGIIILNMYQEGVFETTLDSLKILYASVSNFRHLNEDDMEAVRIYREKERIDKKQKEEDRSSQEKREK